MNTNKVSLLHKVNTLCKELSTEFDQIPTARKEQLTSLSDYIRKKIEVKETPKLVVICTHNSRRSHIGQIWLAVAADYFQLPTMDTYSGGTEATAFNIRAVNAFQKIGFDITTNDEKAENPKYLVTWKDGMKPYQAFSKKYEGEPNPKEKFAAIMVCNSADKGCPIVAGCDFRLSLPYDDPKAFDDTDLEQAKYTERIRQIGREVLYTMSKIKL